VEFASTDDLMKWLTTTKDGMEVSRRIIAIAARLPVVVELYSDGFVKVYSEARARVRIVNRPHVVRDSAAPLADEWVEMQLPPRHQEVYWPGCVRATGQVRKVRPSDLLRRLTDQRLHEALEAIG